LTRLWQEEVCNLYLKECQFWKTLELRAWLVATSSNHRSGVTSPRWTSILKEWRKQAVQYRVACIVLQS